MHKLLPSSDIRITRQMADVSIASIQREQIAAELSRIAAHYLVSFARFCFSFGHQAGGDGGKGVVNVVHVQTLNSVGA